MSSTRRAFAAALAGVPAFAQTIKPGVAARSGSRTIGANDRINVGCIGVGGMGMGHLTTLVKQGGDGKDVRVAAVSDVYKVRAERAREAAGLGNKDVYPDYRDLLARDDVDAVVIATPDHWHAQMALDALASGKDVYLQKPDSLTIHDGRQMAVVMKLTRRILQQ
jgi:predicted dehydrogenase